MKFAWKIFYVSFIITILLFGAGGFVLVNAVFNSSLNSQIQTTCSNNSYVASSFYVVIDNAKSMSYDKIYADHIIKNFKSQVSKYNSKTEVSIGSAEEMSFYDKNSFINKLDYENRGWQIISRDNKKYLQVVSRMNIDKDDFYIETVADITELYTSRDYYCYMYQITLLFVAFFASLILVVFSLYITHPLMKLSSVSKKISEGEFSKRVDVNKKSMCTEEIYSLSKNFNTMADCVENYIELLKKEAQSRDDFVANFTHELKTPLTSIIGYADMLRSYEFGAEQRRNCAEYIYKEGKRLEALSVNLLDIIVLKNNDITLVPIKSEVIFGEIEKTVKFLLEKYNISLKVKTESNVLLIETSMFKTMIYNIIDNACKASEKGGIIELYGITDRERYKISIRDYGRGMNKDELEKIIRPFYMVDKSRSRSQGGAGLGLSLCKEIAVLHGSELEFDSDLGKGTTVTLSVGIYKEE